MNLYGPIYRPGVEKPRMQAVTMLFVTLVSLALAFLYVKEYQKLSRQMQVDNITVIALILSVLHLS